MDIEQLLEDLSSRLDAQARADLAAELTELLEAERAQVDLAARFDAAVGAQVAITARDEGVFRGVVAQATRHFVHLRGEGQDIYVALAAICTVHGLGPAGQTPPGSRGAQTLASVARQAARFGTVVVVGCQGVRTGQVRWAGKDFIDLAPAPGGGGQPVTLALGNISWLVITQDYQG
ncbi:MAG: hypothetical protein Q3999_03170 [Buchananella hordeovulneris]|nr:hypothetical protein [Buchananella hordeovulneris]